MTQLKFTKGKGTDSEILFAEVLVPVPVLNDFTYRIPETLAELAEAGKRVTVPFGKNRIITGIITKIHSNRPKEYTAKNIIDILDETPVIDEVHLAFWTWISEYYLCTRGEVMDAALPSGMKLESRTKILIHPLYNPEKPPPDLTSREMHLMAFFHTRDEFSPQELIKQTKQKSILPVIKKLVEKECLLIRNEIQEGYKPRLVTAVELNPDLDEADHIREVFTDLSNSPAQTNLLMMLLELRKKNDYPTKKELLSASGTSEGVFKSLKDKGILHTVNIKQDRLQEYKTSSDAAYSLNDAQVQALNEIDTAFQSKDVALLHGITGSGKTHVYIEWIQKLTKQGFQVLYLVPEIGLSSQLIQRLSQHFGNEIGIYHSRFNNHERYEIWQKVKEGNLKVVIGVRSALFLPFTNLGGLIVDEEHENTFKQREPNPRYHARDAGIYLATRLFKGKVILGTATPSMESYFNALKGKYGLVNMHERYGNLQMPEVVMVDMKKPIREKTMKSHLTPDLFNEMEEVLKAGNQVILFQNRRGYAPFLECTTCGWVPQCDHCDISMTYHQVFQKLICHYCGHRRNLPPNCSSCGNSGMAMKSFGTEKVEDELPYFFKDYGIARIDQDTTRGKNAYENLIKKFETGEKQIMVGTQMITKGLDLEKVALVGILNADMLIYYPDFRARERAYQLIEQVSGRAGRKHARGKVIIQTFSSGHPIFSFLKLNDFQGFFHTELRDRKQFIYPPYCKLIRLTFKNPDRKTVQESAVFTGQILRKKFGQNMLGPEFPPTARIKNQYLNEILIKLSPDAAKIHQAKNDIREALNQHNNTRQFNKTQVIIDVDPS